MCEGLNECIPSINQYFNTIYVSFPAFQAIAMLCNVVFYFELWSKETFSSNLFIFSLDMI